MGQGDGGALGQVVETLVDGQAWLVRQRDDAPGVYRFDWISGPNPGYGFTSSTNTGVSITREEMDEQIRDFLADVDPTTGYLPAE